MGDTSDGPSPHPAAAAEALTLADPKARGRRLDDLARDAATPADRLAVANAFLAAGPGGRVAALEWLLRWTGLVPPPLVIAYLPRLADATVPAPLRLAAAARLLSLIPDRLPVVRPLAKALTAGLSPLRGLDRLRQLQHRLDASNALDQLIDRKELRVKVVCPRCAVRLPRVVMVEHLWHDHRLFLDGGKVLTPDALLDRFRKRYADRGDPAALDRAWLAATAFDPAADPLETLRAWLAGGDPTGRELDPLLDRARERGAGLCPECFTGVPAAYPPLGPPLAVGHGRLAGDGYAVEVGTSGWLRTLRVTTPDGVTRDGPDGGHALGPRAAATLAALVPALLAVVAAGLWSPTAVGVLFVVAAVVYAAVRLTRRPPPDPDRRAVDAAWTVLARRLVDRGSGPLFLARLARTSLGRGSHARRAGVLRSLLAWADGVADGADETLPLAASAHVLRVDDGGRMGRDRLAGVADLVAGVFKGDRPLPFAEYALATYLDRPDPPTAGERRRLRVLLIGAAFDAGLKARDLLAVSAVAPAVGRATATEPAHLLGLLYGVWATRNRPRPDAVERMETVFDVCRNSPTLAAGWLDSFPDLLTVYRPDPMFEHDLGPVFICGRGVAVGRQYVSNPAAEVSVGRPPSWSRGSELTVGTRRFALRHRPTVEDRNAIRGLLHFRHDVLLPFVENYLEPHAPAALDRLLEPLGKPCPRCGMACVAVPGEVGVPVGPAG